MRVSVLHTYIQTYLGLGLFDGLSGGGDFSGLGGVGHDLSVCVCVCVCVCVYKYKMNSFHVMIRCQQQAVRVDFYGEPHILFHGSL